MYFPDFDYYTPESVEAVSNMLLEKKGAKILSGGTDLIPLMKNGLIEPPTLISLKKVPGLKKIENVAGRGVVIGAASTHNDLIFSEVINKKYNSISNAAQQMAANQVRHGGTIGGNIATALPSADLPPILIVLGAKVTLVTAKGKREVAIEDVFTGPRTNVIEQGEVITEVVIPENAMTGSTYFKYALRKSGALATVGVAAAVQMDGKVIKDIRVAFGAVAPTPMRAKAVEDFLKGKEATEENLEKAADIARGECKPITDHRASEEYRRDMVGVFTKRAIKKAIAEGHN